LAGNLPGTRGAGGVCTDAKSGVSTRRYSDGQVRSALLVLRVTRFTFAAFLVLFFLFYSNSLQNGVDILVQSGQRGGENTAGRWGKAFLVVGIGLWECFVEFTMF